MANNFDFNGKLFINSNGNILIGTSTDSGFKLDVNGTGRFTSTIIGQQGLSISGNGGAITNSANKINIDFASGNARVYSLGTNASTKGGFEFHTNSSDGSLDVIALGIASTGAATFSSSVTATNFNLTDVGGGAVNNVNGNLFLQTGAGTGWIFRNGASGFTEYMRLGSTGNLLINTTTESGFKLDVNGTGRFSGNVGVNTASVIAQLQLNNNTFTSANGFASDPGRIGMMVNGVLKSYVYASTYNDPTFPDYGFVFIHGENTSNYNVWSISPDGPAKGSGLHFIYQANSANIHNQTPAVSFIGSTGNVGIGTTGPQSKLQVARAGNTNGGTILMGVGGSGTSKWSFLAGAHYNQATGSGNGSGSAGVAIIGADATETSNSVYIGGGPYEINPATVILFNTYTETTHNLGGLERMRITSGGNVLINTTTDSGFKLDVNGTARVGALTGTSSVSADSFIASNNGLSVGGYNFYTQTISGAMGILGHNVRASTSVANQVNVVNGGWISSMIKQYFNEGITFHTDTTQYSANAVYPMAASERMRITSGGNVLIGTTTDSGNKLLVVGGPTNLALGAGGTVLGMSGAAGQSCVMGFDGGGMYQEILGSSTATRVLRLQVFNGTGNYAQFFIDGANNYIYTSSNINFGVGTGTPDTKLQVAGNIRLGIGGSNDKLDLMHGAGDGDYGAFRFYQGGVERQTIHSFSRAWQGGTIYSSSSGSININGDYGVTFGVWYDPDAVINTGGVSYFKNNVLIGTTTDAGFKLDVNGTGYFRNILRAAAANTFPIRAIATNGTVSRISFEDPVNTSNDAVWVGSEGFNLCFGSSYNEQARISSNGNLLINTTTDNGYKFEVNGGAYISSFTGIGTTPTSSWSLAVGSLAGADGALKTTGSVNITTGALGVNVVPSATAGRIDASNDIVAFSSSDFRLKENIKPIENALDKVKALTGVEFDWKAEHKEAHGYEGHDTGIIAQEVQEVMPTAVRVNDTGYLAVRYEKLIGLLVEANKELAARVEELEKKLK